MTKFLRLQEEKKREKEKEVGHYTVYLLECLQLLPNPAVSETHKKKNTHNIYRDFSVVLQPLAFTHPQL